MLLQGGGVLPDAALDREAHGPGHHRCACIAAIYGCMAAIHACIVPIYGCIAANYGCISAVFGCIAGVDGGVAAVHERIAGIVFGVDGGIRTVCTLVSAICGDCTAIHRVQWYTYGSIALFCTALVPVIARYR